MKHTWINNCQNDKLIVFFNGWACDSEGFQFLECGGTDVLIFYDYSSLLIEDAIIDVIKSYRQVNVAAWSFGVWVAQYFMEIAQVNAASATAFNGTLAPINESAGIPKAIAEGTLQGLNERTFGKFQRRMCGGGDAWQQFQTHPPKRSFENQKAELACLYRHFQSHQLSTNSFTKAIIGLDDMIFTAKNQQTFWEGKSEIQTIQAPHFCFYNYTQWIQLCQ